MPFINYIKRDYIKSYMKKLYYTIFSFWNKLYFKYRYLI
ncbi:hypothetical protein QIM_1961 [Clostridioides difficile DA00128]|nr:hypothetical protein QCA_2056 [Clostridioides difficile CD40]EQE63326.1 hypothetical protein QCM_1888 [Clostridioides difficile CD46]EQG35681.1 hypothetical protein QIM_1961 [Clostridioides difficile DA00128]EQJ18001.1 hypothetical protein QS3_1903 [Clostridioides difficile P13]